MLFWNEFFRKRRYEALQDGDQLPMDKRQVAEDYEGFRLKKKRPIPQPDEFQVSILGQSCREH